MKHALAVFILATILGLVLRQAIYAADESSPQVSAKNGNVNQDNSVSDTNADAKNATDSGLTIYQGAKWLNIKSLAFTPPPQSEFRKFTAPEKTRPGIAWDFVDIDGESEASAHGVVVGPDGNLIAGPDKIQVFALIPAPDNAGTFPLKAEGNLRPSTQPGNGPGGGSSVSYSWRIKTQDSRHKRLTLASLNTFVLKPAADDPWKINDLTATALDETGTPQPGVVVSFHVKTDKGAIDGQADPFRSETTAVPAMSTDGQPIAFADNPAFSAPQDGAVKYIFTARATGYDAGTLELPICSAHWTERTTYKGFDPLSEPPWLVVGIGNDLLSSASKLTLGPGINAPDVSISVTAGGTASISPETASGVDTNTDVTGKAAGTTSAKAKKTSNDLATMNVVVKNTKTVNVQFVWVKDTGGHSGELSDDAKKAFLKDAQQLWMDQAVVELDINGNNATWNLTKDLGEKPSLAAIQNALSTLNPPIPAADQILLLVWWDFDLGAMDGFEDSRRIVVRKANDGITVAHEIGHGLGIHGHSQEADNLMAGHGVASGDRIRKYQADSVNP